MLADTLRQMKADGVKRALAFATSAYSSYSSCRQYRENIAAAQAAAGEGAPTGGQAARVSQPSPVRRSQHRTGACSRSNGYPNERRSSARIAYTAHSIPLSMAESCDYQRQLIEVARLVSGALGSRPDPLVFQSRSGPASQPWLEPDILDHLRTIRAEGTTDVVIAPIGFVSDHMEVLYDLDTEAALLCRELGHNLQRAATAGTHPKFVQMVRSLVMERMNDSPLRPAVGIYPANPDVCLADCCPAPVRPLAVSPEPTATSVRP